MNYKNIVKGLPKDELLQKYRLLKLPFLYPLVKYLHLNRFLALHFIIYLKYKFFKVRKLSLVNVND